MSTDLLSRPSGGINHPGFGLHLDMSTFYAFPHAWLESPQDNNFYTAAPNYQPHPAPTTATSFDTQHGMTVPTTVSDANVSSPCLSPSKFTASNLKYDQYTTVSPHQTHFQPEQPSPMSYASPTYEPNHAFASANSTQCASSSRQSTFDRGSISSQTSQEPQSPFTRQHKVGRRRKTEILDAGSARATYLEKNRRAASKCRSKQKRQQEDLVEQARGCERKNQCLKAEVSILQDAVRELMEVVGQHSQCPDTRLTRYVQREADRLATGASRESSSIHPQ